MREKHKQPRNFWYTAGFLTLALAVLIGPLSRAMTATDYNWRDVGITNNIGSWTDVAGSSDAQKLIAASDDSVYRSLNGGKNWTVLSSLPVSGVMSVASTGNGDGLYAIKGGSDSIWVSSDGGISWATRSIPSMASYGSTLEISSSGDKLYVSLGKTLYQSSDNGQNWTLKNDMSTCNANIAYTISDDGAKVISNCLYNTVAGVPQYSTDSGTTWVDLTSVGAGSSWREPMISGDGSTMFLSKGSGSAAKVYRSADSGASWQEISTIDRLGLVSYDGSVVMGTAQQPIGDDHPASIWFSKNSGASFTKVDKLNVYGDWVLTSGVISMDKQTLIIGPTNGALSYSDDGGSSWTVDASPKTTKHEWSEVATSIDGKTVYAVNWWYAGPVYKSTDGGTTWSPIEAAGFGYWDNIATSGDGQTIVLAQGYTWYTGYLHISHDGGATWTTVLKDDYRSWTRIAVSENGQDIIATDGWGSGIYVSHDGGATWNNTSPASITDFMSVAMSRDGNTAVAVSSMGNGVDQVYKSNDRGDTWQVLVSAGVRDWQEIACSQDCSKIVATVDGGYVYVSHDGGQTWQEHQELGSKRWGSLAMSYDGMRVALSQFWESDAVYLSDDGGETWTQQANTTGTTDNWMNFAFSADGTVLYGVTGTYGSPRGTGRVYRADRVEIVPNVPVVEQATFDSTNRLVGGKGVPGSMAELKLPDGQVLSVLIGYDGEFSIPIPTEIAPGSTVTLLQRSAAGTPSDPVSLVLGTSTVTTGPGESTLASTGVSYWLALAGGAAVMVMVTTGLLLRKRGHYFRR